MLGFRNRKRNKKICRLFLGVLSIVVVVFVYQVGTKGMVTPKSDGQIIKIAQQYQMGRIFDRNGKEIVKETAEGICWAEKDGEKAFKDILGIDIAETGNSKMTICGNTPFIYGASDNCLEVEDLFSPNMERVGGNVKLTLDQDLQIYIAKLVEKSGYEHASVVVSNYMTGEIYGMLGPIFSETYHPGSTIKPILAAAVLNIRPELRKHTYNCSSANHNFVTTEGTHRINCFGNQYHGKVDMTSAMSCSCNGYFISLLQQVPKEEMSYEMKRWGFDTVISYDSFMYWDHTFLGNTPTDQNYLLAGIGQANVFITPIGMNLATNILLNGGVLQDPTLIKEKQEHRNAKWETIVSPKKQICEKTVADDVVAMMQKVTTEGTGKNFYMADFVAKTGTAQKADSSGKLIAKQTIWTTGGLIAENTPYSVTVCLDNVPDDVSSSVAGTLAKQILTYMTKEE